MIYNSLKCMFLICLGSLLCSCSVLHDEEYESFIKQEEEKIRSEIILLEKQKQANQQEQIALTKQREQLKKEYQLLSQEKAKIQQEKIIPQNYVCGKDVVCVSDFDGFGDCSGSCDDKGCQLSCKENIEYRETKNQKLITGILINKNAGNGFSYEAHVENGRLNGIFKLFKDERIYLVRNYLNGVYDGSEILYYPDGKIKAKEVYDNGRSLSVTQYHPNGELDYRRIPDNDRSIYYHPDGSKKRVISFICPKFMTEVFDEEGKLIEKTVN